MIILKLINTLREIKQVVDSALGEKVENMENDLRKSWEKARKQKDRDVHTEHCCYFCGCKYNDDNCPVVKGKKIQSGPCENM